MSGRLKAIVPYALLVLLAVVLDQAIKLLVEERLPFHELVELVPFFGLFRTYNTGVAFSMFSSFHDLGLLVMSLLVVAFVLFLASRTESHQRWARLGFALVVGGAVGNLIDRAVHGHVIDYFLFHTPVWSFAVFNLADVFITLGAGLVLLEEIIVWKRARRGSNAS